MGKQVRRDPLTYWANLPIDKFGSELMDRIGDYYQFLWATGKIRLFRQAYQYYLRPGLLGGRVATAGTEGELVTISVNHTRNLLKHLHTMTTSQPINWEPQATNTDQKSQEQCILANGLLDYFRKQKRVERFLKTGVEFALLLGEGFLSVTWDATKGEAYGVNPETGATIYQGDIKIGAYTALDAIRDVNKDSAYDHDWIITRDWVNRYDLMAKYPELAKDIAKVSDADWESLTWKDTRLFMYEKYDCDDLPVYTFYHRKTEAVPQGRMVQMMTHKICLSDGPLPYRALPVYRIASGEWIGTPFGYTTCFDLLPLQQMIDMCYSAAATNNASQAVQNFWCKKGDMPEVTDLAGGLKVVQSDEMPQPLNLLQTSPETYNLLKIFEQVGETLSGVNAVARGNPDQALGKGASGSAMALVQAQALMFSMDLQQSYKELVEDVGTAILTILRDYASVPRVALIAGKSNRQFMKSFTGDDLSEIDRVTVEMGNPAMNTTAGRLNMADQLLSKDKLADAAQYVEVATTGKLDPIIEGEQAELMNIRGENEALSQGQPVSALITDNPMLHVKEHLTVLSSPESRANPMIVQNTLSHVQQHLTLYPQMSPVLCAILGIPPPPPPIGPAGLPSGPPNAGPSAQHGAGGGHSEMVPGNPVMKQAAHVAQPQMPKVPPGTPAPVAAAAVSQGARA